MNESRREKSVRRRLEVAVLAFAFLLPSLGSAQTTPAEAYVVGLDGDDIVIDVSSRHLDKGALVEIWRPLLLKHPVTGEPLTDRFRIGQLRISQALERMSLAKPVGKLLRPAQVGDVVIVSKRAVEKEALPDTPVPSNSQPVPILAVAPGDPEAARLSALVEALRGTAPATRVEAYERFVAEHPKSRFAPTLQEEAFQLRRLMAFSALARGEDAPSLESFEPPERVLAKTPLTLALELGGRASGAVLHSRNAGEVAYQTTPMTAVGPGFYSVTLEAERVKTPWLEVFVEATSVDGTAHAITGQPQDPLRIAVDELPTPSPPERFPVQLGVITDYADWNNLRGNDVAWQTEGFVGLRLQDTGLRAVRTGFGVFRGVGGSLDELDQQGLSARKVGLTYGYLEGEFGVSHFTGLLGRLVTGLGDDGVTAGAQLLLRLGNDRETNLLLGGEALGGVGLRSITQLELTTLERFPALFRIEVTNQPAGSQAPVDVRPAQRGADPGETSLAKGQVGARAIAQLGYRVVSELVVSGRVSYQGRTINHAGPGLGGGVSYQW